MGNTEKTTGSDSQQTDHTDHTTKKETSGSLAASIPQLPALSDEEELCRICRQDDSDLPLYHPCKCSGSIRFVHQPCLDSWLSRRATNRCELCSVMIVYRSVYPRNLPKRLSHLQVLKAWYSRLAEGRVVWLRVTFVFSMWLAALPLFSLISCRFLLFGFFPNSRLLISLSGLPRLVAIGALFPLGGVCMFVLESVLDSFVSEIYKFYLWWRQQSSFTSSSSSMETDESSQQTRAIIDLRPTPENTTAPVSPSSNQNTPPVTPLVVGRVVALGANNSPHLPDSYFADQTSSATEDLQLPTQQRPQPTEGTAGPHIPTSSTPTTDTSSPSEDTAGPLPTDLPQPQLRVPNEAASPGAAPPFGSNQVPAEVTPPSFTIRPANATDYGTELMELIGLRGPILRSLFCMSLVWIGSCTFICLLLLVPYGHGKGGLHAALEKEIGQTFIQNSEHILPGICHDLVEHSHRAIGDVADQFEIRQDSSEPTSPPTLTEVDCLILQKSARQRRNHPGWTDLCESGNFSEASSLKYSVPIKFVDRKPFFLASGRSFSAWNEWVHHLTPDLIQLVSRRWAREDSKLKQEAVEVEKLFSDVATIVNINSVTALPEVPFVRPTRNFSLPNAAVSDRKTPVSHTNTHDPEYPADLARASSVIFDVSHLFVQPDSLWQSPFVLLTRSFPKLRASWSHGSASVRESTGSASLGVLREWKLKHSPLSTVQEISAEAGKRLVLAPVEAPLRAWRGGPAFGKRKNALVPKFQEYSWKYLMRPLRVVELASDPSVAVFGQGNIELEVLGFSHAKHKLEVPYTIVGYLELITAPMSRSGPSPLSLRYTLQLKLHPFPPAFHDLGWTAVIWLVGVNRAACAAAIVVKIGGTLVLVVASCLIARDWINAVRGVQEITAAEEEEQAKAAAAAIAKTAESRISEQPTMIWRFSNQLGSSLVTSLSILKVIMEPRTDTRIGASLSRVLSGASSGLKRIARDVRYIVWDIGLQSVWKVVKFVYSLVIFILSFQELLFNMGLNYVLDTILPITMGHILMSLAGASYWLQIPSSWSAWHMDENIMVITVVSHCIGRFYLRLVAKMVFRSLEVLQLKYAEAVILGNYSLLGFFVFSFALLRGGSATGGPSGDEDTHATPPLHPFGTRAGTRRSRSRGAVLRSGRREQPSTHASVDSICRAFFSTASWGDLTQGLLSFLTAHVIVLAAVVFLSSSVTQVLCPRLLPLVVIPYAANPVELHRPWSFEIYRVIVALKRLLVDVSITEARKIMPLTQCLVHTTLIVAFLRVWHCINNPNDDAISAPPGGSRSTRSIGNGYSRSGETQAYYLKCLAAYITYTSGFGHCLTPAWKKWLNNFDRRCDKDLSRDGNQPLPVRCQKRKLNDLSSDSHSDAHRWKSSRSTPDSRNGNPVNMSPATSVEWRIESEELSRSAPLHLLSVSSSGTAERRAESAEDIVPTSGTEASSLSSVSRLRVQHTSTVCEELGAVSPSAHTRAHQRRLWGSADLQSSEGSAVEITSSSSDDEVSDSSSRRDNRSSFSELDDLHLDSASCSSSSSSSSSSSPSSSSSSSSASSSSVLSSSPSPGFTSSQRSSSSLPAPSDEETGCADDDSSSAGEFENTCLWVRRTHRGMALPPGWVVKEVASRVFKNLEKIYIAEDRVMAVDCRLESGTHTTFRTCSFNKNDFIMAGVFVARVWNATPLRTGTIPPGSRDSYSENFDIPPPATQRPFIEPESSQTSSSKEDIQFQVWMPKTEIPNTDLGHVRFAASKIFMTFEPNVIIQDEGRSLSFPYKARGFYMTRNHDSDNVSGLSSSGHSDDASTTYTFRYVVAEGPKALIAEEFGGLPAPFRWKGRSIEPVRQLVRSVQVISACAWPALLLLVALVLATSLCVATSILCGRQLVRLFFWRSSWLKSTETGPSGLDRVLLQYHALAVRRATTHLSNFYLEPQGRLTDNVKQASILTSRITDLVTFAMGLSFLYLCILLLTHIRSHGNQIGARGRARNWSGRQAGRRSEHRGTSNEEEARSPQSSRGQPGISQCGLRAQGATSAFAPRRPSAAGDHPRSTPWRRWRTGLGYSWELLRNLQVKTRTLVINGMSDWRRTVSTRVRPVCHQAAFFVGLMVFYVSMPLCLGGFLDLLVLRPTLYRFDGGRAMSSIVLHFAVQWWLIGLPGFALWWGSLISINFGVWLRPLLLTGSTDLPDRDTLREIGNLSVRFLSRRHRIQCDTVKKFYCKFLAPLLRDWLYWFGAPLLITVAGCILDLVLEKKFFIRGEGLQKPFHHLLSLHQNTIQIFVSFRALRTLFKHAKDDFGGVYQRLWEQKFLVKKELLNFTPPRE